MDINIDALYNILKQNQGDVNDALGYKKKVVGIKSNPLALVVEKTNVSKRKEKVVVSSDSKGSGVDDFNVKKVEKNADEKKRDMSKVKCYNCKKEGYFAKDFKKVKFKDYEYYKTKMLLAKKDKDEQVLLAEDQAWMESRSDSDQETNANMVFMAQIEKVLSDSEASSSAADKKISEDLEIEKCLEHLNDCENKLHKMGQTNQTIHMIMPSKDNLYNGRKGIDFENPSYFEKAKDLRPTLYDEKVIGLVRSCKSFGKRKKNLETIESLKSKGFESSETVISESENQSENDCRVVEKECDKVENSKVIAPGMFKLSVSQSVSPILMSKTSCESNNVENTSSSVRRPKNSGVIWKKKGSSNTSNVDLSYVSHSKLNKDVKRYSRKDLLSCNNSHPGETSSAYVCNDTMNASCNPRMCVVLDDNNFFIFNDESVRISPVSKMPFRKKPCDSMNVRSKSNMIKSLPRYVHKWLPKMQPLAEPVAKWFPIVKHQIDKIV
nr:hypothetical protein [Tanacetum cinerariifolium]